jgi:hypothetical protein
MLSNDEKLRIQLEETYRREVRDIQESQHRGGWSKFSPFLNSNFGIWLLSSCVLGLLSLGFTMWEKSRDERRRQLDELHVREEAVRRLDAEIASRLSYVNVVWSTQLGSDSAPTVGRAAALLALDRPNLVEYPMSVFPDFSTRTLRSLIWELKTVVPDSERTDIEAAWRAAQFLPRFFLRANLNMERLPSDRPELGQGMKRAALIELFIKKGWPSPEEIRRFVLEERTRSCLLLLNLARWDKPLKSLSPSVTGPKPPACDEP